MTSVYNQETATAMYLREQCDIAMKEGLAKGIEQGREEGIEQGIEQGIEKGIEQGVEQGLLQGKINTVIDFYKKNLIPIDFAAKELGMSEKEFLKMIK